MTDDNWIAVEDWPELINKVKEHKSLFVTAGQITQVVMDALASQANHILLRTAMPVKIDLPQNVTWIKAIGPFHLPHELQLLEQYKVDAIISKNSGGDSTYAKIEAAREKNIPVYQFKRPTLIATKHLFDNQTDCLDLLVAIKNKNESNPDE